MSDHPAVKALTDFDLDSLCRKAGGHFRATALIQKRLREIIRYTIQHGENAVKPDNKTLIWRVLQELEEGHISLMPPEDMRDVLEADGE